MKSFAINLGKNNEVWYPNDLNDNPVIINQPGNVDACVKGIFRNAAQPDPGGVMGISAYLYINADVLKEYFTDVTGVEATGVEARVGTAGLDGTVYVIITPTNIG